MSFALDLDSVRFVVVLASFALAAWLAVPALGNHGLWLAIMVLMAVRALTLGLGLKSVLRSVGA